MARTLMPSRRQVLLAGTASVIGLTFVDGLTDRIGASTTCADGTCTATTVWMLDPDWGYARGPHGKTRLVSSASRAAAANRVARTEQEANDMNLHACSYAPSVPRTACANVVDTAFADHAYDWTNPWNGASVSLLDLRHLPAAQDLFACPVVDPPRPVAVSPDDVARGPSPVVTGFPGPGGASAHPGALAFTGASDRRMLFIGVGALATGIAFRAAGRSRPAGSEQRPDLPR